MNILNLRNVGSMEIPDSFRGILRISPNGSIDETSELLKQSKPIKLSDSEGNILPLTFKPKEFETIVIDYITGTENLIHITQEYSNLFVSKSLNLCSLLYLHPKENKVPLIFSNGLSSLGYPKEAPENVAYFNHNNKFNFSKSLSIDENIDTKIAPDHDIYKDKDQWVKINNEYPQRYVQYQGEMHKVPFLKKREYALGHIGKHYFKRSSSSTIYDLSADSKTSEGAPHTQLSYIPVELLSYSTIESQIGGLYRAPLAGRYFKLNSVKTGDTSNNSGDELAKILFGNDIKEEDPTLAANAPIMGIPVQSGTIHYNAIPAKHYFFHLVRYYDSANMEKYLERASKGNTITSAYTVMPHAISNLMRNFVLCDGKDIKTGYPNISSEEIEKKLPANNSAFNTFSAIAKSITKSDTATTFPTPPLFEFDQLSLRFLRGLNWLKDEAKNTYTNNTKTYVKIYDENDAPRPLDRANHKKDINEVGIYYSNSDSNIQKNYKHAHLLFASPNINEGEEEVNRTAIDKGKKITITDSLNNEKTMFQGKLASELPEDDEEWFRYVELSSAVKCFHGSKMLKTTGSLRLNGRTFDSTRELQLQNYPISARGGSNAYFHSQTGCIRFGKRHIGKCMNHRTRCQGTYKIRDGYYSFASCDNSATSWRFLTSMPRGSKYGLIDSPEQVCSMISDAKNVKIKIDDSLSSPAAINLIPLMKI